MRARRGGRPPRPVGGAANDRVLGYRVETASTRDELLGRLFGGGVDLLVTSNALQRDDVTDIVRELRLYRHETAVCVICERDSADEYRRNCPVPCSSRNPSPWRT